MEELDFSVIVIKVALIGSQGSCQFRVGDSKASGLMRGGTGGTCNFLYFLWRPSLFSTKGSKCGLEAVFAINSSDFVWCSSLVLIN